MSVQLETAELDGLRRTIDGLIAQALHYSDLEKIDGPVALVEKYGKTATALFRAANSVMNSQGVFYEEYIHRPEWVALRRLQQTYNSL